MISDSRKIRDWLKLYTVPHIGIIGCLRLIRQFGSPAEVFKASKDQLLALENVGPKVVEAIGRGGDEALCDRQQKLFEQGSFKFMTVNCPEYPDKLKNIYDPPPFLYLEGDESCLFEPTIAIVGSRSLSVYGKRMAEKLASELAQAGFTIVSGFARGIDSIAHRAALEAGGKTAAVFGSGLDVIYPPENKAIYRNLVLNGCALSEFFLGVHPDRHHFPRRNRIISGLSLGVIVVEAGEKSGALLTAEHALEQGREVFAVPGNITSKTSSGTNRIIKEGAKLVTCAEDVLEELKFIIPIKKSREPEQVAELSDDRRQVYDLLSDEPQHIDKIVKKANISVSQTLEIMLDLELTGLVEQLSGKMFVKRF